jgi:small-conductance mechanosensitive channel
MAGLPFFYGGTVTDLVLSIILTILVVAVALGFALWLRQLVVRRLKKTVLDNWLVQTIGVLVMIPVVIAGFVLVSLTVTLSIDFLVTVWNKLTAGLRASDIANGLWAIVWDLIETLLIIVLAVGVGRTLMRLVVGRLGEQRLDINIRTLIGRISYGLIVLICIFWILSLWNVSITVPVTVISALSVAVAFAIQDILKDLVAGLYILFERPFHIGDQITVANYTGRVESVEVRATKLRLTSGEEMTIPNALVFGGTVVNNTQFDERRATIALTMPQQDFDKEKTPAKILKTVRELENVLVKPEPFVYVVHYTSSATAGTAGAAAGGSSDESAGTAGGMVVLNLRFWMPTGRYQTVTEVMSALHEVLPDVDLVVEESGGNV